MRVLLAATIVAASTAMLVGRTAAGKDPPCPIAGGPAGAALAPAVAAGCHRERAGAIVKRFLEVDGLLRRAARADGAGVSGRGLLAARALRGRVAAARRAEELVPRCHAACADEAPERAVDLEIVAVEAERALALAPVRLAGHVTPLLAGPDAKDSDELHAALPLLEEMTAEVVGIMAPRELRRAREDALAAVARLGRPLPEDPAAAAALAAARAAVTRRLARLEAALARDPFTSPREMPGAAALERELRVRVELGLGLSIRGLLDFGQARVADARAEIEWLARERLGAESAAAALAHAAAVAPEPDEPEAARRLAERAVADALRFVRARGLASVPEEVAALLDVRRGEGRAGSYGHYMPPGWSGKRAGYVMSFPAQKLDADARLAMRRANFLQWTRVVAVHETYPGHHLHFGIGAVHPRAIRHRRPHEALVVEGWGLLAERIMFEAGYFDADPLEHLAYLAMRLWRAARVVADAKLLAREADVAGAAAVLQEHGLLPAGVARDQAARQEQRRGYYSCYAVGEARLAALRERFVKRALARGGSASDARRAFADRLVRAGTSTPIEAVEVAVMGERASPEGSEPDQEND